MPASIAHMLIAHKALKELQTDEDKELVNFAKMLDRPEDKKRDKKPRKTEKDEGYWRYTNLGSLGPDLYYFENLVRGFLGMVSDGYVLAKAVTPWAYRLHSSKPNEFVLNLIEIMFRDVERNGKKINFGENDNRKLAYIAGHLSHIAADQTIHPLVNELARPGTYYMNGKNREKHREAEVYQDYFLYQEVYRKERDEEVPGNYNFFEQNFQNWPDCVRGSKNTEDWFRYFLQRGFIETYGVGPDEGTIENSVDGLLTSLWFSKQAGPYKKADEEYKKYETNGEKFQEYAGKPKYLKSYKKAVELTGVYLRALYKVYLILTKVKSFGNDEKERFCGVVSGADLSCPLEEDILEEAQRKLDEWK